MNVSTAKKAMKKNLQIWIFGLVVVSFITACTAVQELPTVASTPAPAIATTVIDGMSTPPRAKQETPIASSTATNRPTMAFGPTAPPNPREYGPLLSGSLLSTLHASEEGVALIYRSVYRTEPSEQEGWNRLTNQFYGFELLVPDTLVVETSLNYILIQWEDQELVLAFRRTDEEVNIQRTGLPEGMPVQRGTIHIFGQDTPREVLVSEGLDMLVLYYGGAAVEVGGGLMFSASLETTFAYYRSGAEYDGIPLAIQEQADQIMESLSLVDNSE